MSDINYNADAAGNPPNQDTAGDSAGKRIVKHPFVLRLLYTVGFAFMAWVLLWFVFAVTLLQLVVGLISGRRNEQIAEFGTKLSWWMRDLVRFLTGASTDLPFPLGDFPTQ